MQCYPFGKSGIKTTRLGLGLAALGRPGYINLGHADDLDRDYDVAAMQAGAFAVLDAAWDAGIRYFDAARSYGRAEEFLANWLTARKIDVNAVAVGSKWGYTYTAEWQVSAEKHEVKDHSLPMLQRQIGESHTLLGNHLDLYQIHSATLDSGVMDNQDVLSRLAALRNDGLLIGFSVSGANQAATIEKALSIRFDGELLFGGVQATFNLLERSAESALHAANDAGLGVIVKEALSNGRLTPRNDMPEFAEQRALLDRISAENGTTIDALAIAFVLSQPWVSVVLSGAATVAHLQSNVCALDVAWSVELDAQLADLTETAEAYWQTRSNLAWN
ncbi:MAG: aldo/keto reductase [Anaerolineae bacterium]|nr:aldo/keto reductase [Anaerolineae bacterium]